MPKKKPAKQPKRPNGDGSIYLRKDGKWVAAVSLGKIGEKRIRRKMIGDTRSEAREKLNKLLMKHGRVDSLAADITVNGLLTRWLETVINSMSRNTRESYTHTATYHIAAGIGTVRLIDLSANTIRAWLSTLKCGAATSQKAYDVLGGALKYAIAEGFIRSNPLREVKRPKYVREEIKPFTLAQTKLILAEKSPYSTLLRLIFSVGLRQGEAFGIQWKHIDFDGEKLSIVRQACEVGGSIEYKAPKTRAGRRTIELDPKLVAGLATLRKTALKHGRAGKEDLVFVSPDGQPLRRNNFANRFWKPILTTLQLEHRGLHHARHTAATLMLTASPPVPITVVSGILGHANPAITLKIYAHFISDQQDSAVKARSSYLGS